MMTPTQMAAGYVNQIRALRDMTLPLPRVLTDIRLKQTEHREEALAENVLLNPVRRDTALQLPHVQADKNWKQTVCPATVLAENA